MLAGAAVAAIVAVVVVVVVSILAVALVVVVTVVFARVLSISIVGVFIKTYMFFVHVKSGSSLPCNDEVGIYDVADVGDTVNE